MEASSHPGSGGPLRRIVLEPITRVEGHGMVTLQLDEAGKVQQARFHGVEFRGFEAFLRGRPVEEVPVLVQRLCGICPVSHHLAAAKALDALAGVVRLTAPAEKLRRLLHAGQILQSHALHFFHLASPDLLLGLDAPPDRRNLAGLLADQPEAALQGIRLRAFGQEVIRHLTGKRVHGVAALAGGMNRPLDPAARDALRRDLPQVLAWSRAAVALAQRSLEAREDWTSFAAFPSNFLSLVGPTGDLEFYDGVLRAVDADGGVLLEGADPRDHARWIHQEVEDWSYMKFPFLADLGPGRGWYRVGPLARLTTCRRIPTPLAEAARVAFRAALGEAPPRATLATHWARMIELLHAAELIEGLLEDPDISGTDLQQVPGEAALEGVGVLEAPRGTLIHHYRIDGEGLVVEATLIVGTTHNNRAMNEALRQVACTHLAGATLTDALLGQLEVALRAFDPCLSCATHALGRMPLRVDLRDAGGALLDRRLRPAGGAA